MHWIDWTIVGLYLAWIVWDGLRLTKRSQELEGYFLGGRSLPWWAVGLSVMATQLSAITMIGGTGQGYTDGMRFLQFYYALPLAMIVLSVTLVPFFHNAKVYTAYEYLERRFDAKTRAFTSLLFLLSRSMSLGVVISAPAVVLSVVLGFSVTGTALLIALPTAVYTMFGGVQAVTWTDVKQMVLIVGSLLAAVVALVLGLPDDIGVVEALKLAGATGRMQTFDFTFDLTNQYTFWSGTIAALFLFCSYFGTDQSQVQRYLTTASVDDARGSLLMSAYYKIPLQALVLLVGVLMFLFYVFTPTPMLFNSVHERELRQGPRASEYAALERRFEGATASRAAAAGVAAREGGTEREAARREFVARDADVKAIRGEALALVRSTTGDPAFNDVNYVFPTFIVTHLPIALPGLLIAAIFAAAMSTIAGELSALSTATIIDFYRRFWRPDGDDASTLRASRLATGFWGIFASVVAVWAAELGSLIEVVNRFGSLFYGSILGVFILAIGWKGATANGAFIGLIAGMGSVAWAAAYTNVAFLWHNVIGAVAVVVVGLLVSVIERGVRGRPRMIRIFITGGTFDKTYDEIEGKLTFTDTHLNEMLQLGRSQVDVSVRTLMMVDSMAMTADDRAIIVRNCLTCEESHIVVTHGTDTMVETAAAIAAGVPGKTIVLTGAMVPYAFGSSDGLFNLGSALSLAQVLPPGVYVAMNGRHFAWDRVRKNRETGVFEEI